MQVKEVLKDALLTAQVNLLWNEGRRRSCTGRNGGGIFQEIYSAFSWRDWGIPRKDTVCLVPEPTTDSGTSQTPSVFANYPTAIFGRL